MRIDRIQELLDPLSPFLELSPFAANDMYDGPLAAAGIVTGIGRISGSVISVPYCTERELIS